MYIISKNTVMWNLFVPVAVVDESSFEIESSSIMRGSRRVLVKVLLFQLDGCGHPQDDATSSFFLDP